MVVEETFTKVKMVFGARSQYKLLGRHIPYITLTFVDFSLNDFVCYLHIICRRAFMKYHFWKLVYYKSKTHVFLKSDFNIHLVHIMLRWAMNMRSWLPKIFIIQHVCCL